MRPGPTIGSGTATNGDDRTNLEKATAKWGQAPDWVIELARAADGMGQRLLAEKIGCSITLISQVLNNKYAGDMAKVEERVRGALMGLMVECPILGEIDRNRCLQEQQEPFRATSAFRAQIYHACRNGCPNARPRGGKQNAE